MFEGVACVGVKDGEGPSVDEGAMEAATRCGMWSDLGGRKMGALNARASAMGNRRRSIRQRNYSWGDASTSAVSDGLLDGLINGLLTGLGVQCGHPWSWRQGRNMEGC